MVRACGDEISFTVASSGRDGKRRQVQVSDMSGEITLTLFDSKTSFITEVNVGQVVSITNASLGFYRKLWSFWLDVILRVPADTQSSTGQNK